MLWVRWAHLGVNWSCTHIYCNSGRHRDWKSHSGYNTYGHRLNTAFEPQHTPIYHIVSSSVKTSSVGGIVDRFGPFAAAQIQLPVAFSTLLPTNALWFTDMLLSTPA